MPARTGPALPKALLEELEGQSNDGRNHRRKVGVRQRVSRKEARKQARHQQKQQKSEHYNSAHSHVAKPHAKRPAAHEHPDSPAKKKVRMAPSALALPGASGKGKKKNDLRNDGSDMSDEQHARDGMSKLKPSKTTTLERLTRQFEANPSRRKKFVSPVVSVSPRTQQEEEEDAYIAYLEAKLGWIKGGRKTAKYGTGEEDGLDDLLNDLDTLESSVFSQVSQSKSDVKGFADDDAEQDMLDTGESSESDEEGSESQEGSGPSGGEGSEEWAGFGSEEEAVQPVKTPQSSIEADDAFAAPMPGLKYVPPHMRDHSQGAGHGNAEADLKLIRQLKGLLNRMSEQNIASIIDGVEEIYRNQRRHDVTATLTALIIDGISAHSMLLDSYVVLHAAFVSTLHKLIGIEFAAYFVQNVVAAYESHFADLQISRVSAAAINDATGGPQQENGEAIGKECSNLIILLSELYNFQVISCVLIYDIIRGLLDGDLTEFKVELLLKVTRNSGQQLRQDDPTALKSIIEIVQSKLSGEANAMSSRTRFMVETLANLKNNKLKRNAMPTAGGESVDRLKKFLAGLSKKRHVLSHEPLRVSLEDLHSAESKGKWWLVGAAWGGDPLVEHQENQRAVTEKDEADTLSQNALLKLARKQGMNTEIRRGIFVVLMSSEDYVDACERLSQLKLTEIQQREIIRVILHCCGNEKSYNPYYALIGQQLCRSTHSHAVTLQFCLWDFLRDLGETNVGGAEVIKNLGEDSGFNVKHISSTRMRNIAKAYGWWVAKDCCTLAILKPVDFTILKQQSHTFLKELLSQIFISTQVSTPPLSGEPNVFPTTRNRGPLEEVFMKATRMQNLSVGLMYFIGEAFKGDNSEGNGFIKWASQVAKDTLRTGMDVVAGL